MLPGHAACGATAPPSAPACSAALGQGRALDEAGVRLAVISLEGVGGVPGGRRGHDQLHVNTPLELLVGLLELCDHLMENELII